MRGPRLDPIDVPTHGPDADRFARLLPPGMPPPALYRVMARHAALWRAMVDRNVIGPTGLMDIGTLPRRLREIVLLRTCVANGCDYEFNLHVQTISERMGLTLLEIFALRHASLPGDTWSVAERAAVALVDALVGRRALADDEFARARAHHTDEVLIEITHLAGLYTGVAMMVELARPPFDLLRVPEPVLARPDGAAA